MDGARRIFYISEILSVILDNLTDDKRSTVYLAYSSKAISSTALDYLWADMASFAPFVPLLPKPVQDIWDPRFSITMLPHIKCPTSEHWKLFDLYAYRVRRIRPGEDFLDRALYQRLASVRTGTDLFPRLTSLRCYLLNPLTPGVKLFPSALRSLSIYPEYALGLDGRVELALRQAVQDAPLLEELYVVGTFRPHSDTALQPLGFRRLHTVHLIARMLRPADLQSFTQLLSSSPILNLGIALHASSEVSFKPDMAGIPSCTFPCVETIRICDGPRRAADIVSRICSPYLHSVTFETWDRFASISEYGRLFALLAQRRPPVYALEIKIGHVYVNTRNEYVRGFLAVLEPLVDAGLARLKVEMSIHGAWQIEEDVKKRLRPEAWPTLAYFEFVLIEASAHGTLPLTHLDDVGP